MAKKIWPNNPEFWYDQHVRNFDINRLHREMIGDSRNYMRGGVTRMETYIKLRTLIYDFNHGCCIFLFNWPSQTSIEAMYKSGLSSWAGAERTGARG